MTGSVQSIILFCSSFYLSIETRTPSSLKKMLEALFGKRQTNLEIIEEEAVALEKRQRRREREASRATRRMFKQQADAYNLMDDAMEEGNSQQVHDLVKDKLAQAAQYRQQSRAKRYKSRQLGERATSLALQTDDLAMDRANMRSVRALERENRVLGNKRVEKMAEAFSKGQTQRHEVQKTLNDAMEDDMMDVLDGQDLLETDEAIRDQAEQFMQDAALAQAPSVLPQRGALIQGQARMNANDGEEENK